MARKRPPKRGRESAAGGAEAPTQAPAAGEAKPGSRPTTTGGGGWPSAVWPAVAIAALAIGLGCGWVLGGQDREAATVAEPEPTERALSPDLEPFLNNYFATWSAQDLEAYRAHFHEQAVIMLIDGGRLITRQPLDPFIEQQAQAHAAAQVPMTEHMTAFEALEDGAAASVEVQWELVQGAQRRRGVDRFQLMRDEAGRWRILALTFYGAD